MYMNKSGVVVYLDKYVVECFDEGVVAYVDKNNEIYFDADTIHNLDGYFYILILSHLGIVY